MSARIIDAQGRVIASSGWGLRPIADRLVQITSPERTQAEIVAERANAAVYIDPKSGLAYQIKEKLDPKEWVTADILMGWYSASFPMVVSWVNHGRVAAAMERGSPTKRYRVLDPKYLLDEKVRRLSGNKRLKGIKP